jgi:hypothetical protein
MYFSKNQSETIRAYVAAQLRLDASASIKLLLHSWDSIAVCVDDDLIFKFPRDAGAEVNLRKECAVLALLQNRVSLPIPQMIINEGEYVFSSHRMLPGSHLTTDQYMQLPEAAKDELAQAMASFFAEIHKTSLAEVRQIGIGKIDSYLPPAEILARTKDILPPSLRPFLMETMERYSLINVRHEEEVFGYFDGHGENMAFDHQAQRLRGIFDFSDCGIDDFHKELHCPNWISPDLTARVIDRYEGLTGRVVDRDRVDLYTAICRFSDLAEVAASSEGYQGALDLVTGWYHTRTTMVSS